MIIHRVVHDLNPDRQITALKNVQNTMNIIVYEQLLVNNKHNLMNIDSASKRSSISESSPGTARSENGKNNSTGRIIIIFNKDQILWIYSA